MALLHSFYCWGQAATVLLSTVFFILAGTENWRIMAVLWAVIPLADLLMFIKAPIGSLIDEGEQGLKGFFRGFDVHEKPPMRKSIQGVLPQTRHN